MQSIEALATAYPALARREKLRPAVGKFHLTSSPALCLIDVDTYETDDGF
jgi:hypothetical protein